MRTDAAAHTHPISDVDTTSTLAHLFSVTSLLLLRSSVPTGFYPRQAPEVQFRLGSTPGKHRCEKFSLLLPFAASNLTHVGRYLLVSFLQFFKKSEQTLSFFIAFNIFQMSSCLFKPDIVPCIASAFVGKYLQFFYALSFVLSSYAF